MDWEAGDLAMCINSGMLRTLYPDIIVAAPELTLCRVYTVAKPEAIAGTIVGLHLVEQASKAALGFNAHRFIKVTPEEADDFDATVIYELNYAPSPAFTNAEMEARVPSPASTPTLAGDVVGGAG